MDRTVAIAWCEFLGSLPISALRSFPYPRRRMDGWRQEERTPRWDNGSANIRFFLRQSREFRGPRGPFERFQLTTDRNFEFDASITRSAPNGIQLFLTQPIIFWNDVAVATIGIEMTSFGGGRNVSGKGRSGRAGNYEPADISFGPAESIIYGPEPITLKRGSFSRMVGRRIIKAPTPGCAFRGRTSGFTMQTGRGWHQEARNRKILRRQGRYIVTIRPGPPALVLGGLPVSWPRGKCTWDALMAAAVSV